MSESEYASYTATMKQLQLLLFVLHSMKTVQTLIKADQTVCQLLVCSSLFRFIQ